MQFKSIFFGNLAEVALPLVARMKRSRRQEEVVEDHGLCDRFLFSASDNRLLVTPFPISKEFFADATKLLDFKNVVNVWPAKVGESLCRAVLQDKKLLELVVAVIRDNPGIAVHSYVGSVEFRDLLRYLRNLDLAFVAPEVPADDDIWTTAFFDSKAGFRQAVAQMDADFPEMPVGSVCGRAEEVIHWAKYLFQKGAGCVLKTNHGLAGAGLVILRRDEIDIEKLPEVIADILRGESYWRKDPIVVEEYIPPDKTVCGGAPNIELRTSDGKVEPLYLCGMRVTDAGSFRGVEIGKGAVPQEVARVITAGGEQFGKFLLVAGYRGFFEIDWVAGQDKKLYPIEANLRRTGGTHVFETAKRLLGADFLLHYYIVANNLAPAPRFKNQNYARVKKQLAPWLYPIAGKKEGVILTVINLLPTGRLGYLVIGPDRSRVVEIEEAFLHELSA